MLDSPLFFICVMLNSTHDDDSPRACANNRLNGHLPYFILFDLPLFGMADIHHVFKGKGARGNSCRECLFFCFPLLFLLNAYGYVQIVPPAVFEDKNRGSIISILRNNAVKVPTDVKSNRACA